MSSSFAAPPLPDFSGPDAVRTFQVVNDGVMGGLSTSRVRSASGSLVFEGEVSLANNGGFASFRGPVGFPAETAALLVTVRGDGRRYKLTLKLDDGAGSPQYQAAFSTSPEWNTLRFRPADFQASFRGRPVAAPPMRFGDVRFLGVLISDRESGPFRMELRDVRIEAGERRSGA